MELKVPLQNAEFTVNFKTLNNDQQKYYSHSLNT